MLIAPNTRRQPELIGQAARLCSAVFCTHIPEHPFASGMATGVATDSSGVSNSGCEDHSVFGCDKTLEFKTLVGFGIAFASLIALFLVIAIARRVSLMFECVRRGRAQRIRREKYQRRARRERRKRAKKQQRRDARAARREARRGSHVSAQELADRAPLPFADVMKVTAAHEKAERKQSRAAAAQQHNEIEMGAVHDDEYEVWISPVRRDRVPLALCRGRSTTQ